MCPECSKALQPDGQSATIRDSDRNIQYILYSYTHYRTYTLSPHRIPIHTQHITCIDDPVYWPQTCNVFGPFAEHFFHTCITLVLLSEGSTFPRVGTDWTVWTTLHGIHAVQRGGCWGLLTHTLCLFPPLTYLCMLLPSLSWPYLHWPLSSWRWAAVGTEIHFCIRLQQMCRECGPFAFLKIHVAICKFLVTFATILVNRLEPCKITLKSKAYMNRSNLHSRIGR